MPYVVTSLITLLFALIETSLLPHFKFFGVTPFLTLAFISVLSVKYRGFVHLFIAFFAGLYFDFVSSGVPGLFTGVFVTVALLGRVLYFRDSGYDSTQSFYWLLGLSTLFIYLVNGSVLFQTNFNGWQKYLVIVALGVALTLIFGLAVLIVSDRFIDWLNKKNEERFR